MVDSQTATCTQNDQRISNSLTFEQPLNETVRLCLRLETLLTQFYTGLTHIGCDNDQSALQALLKYISVIDRPDIKSKLTQALSQQATSLAQLEQFPQVDKVHLYDILGQLDSLLNQLHHSHCKLGGTLRQHPFLGQVFSQLNNPAGLCAFACPAYALWQRQSPQQRSHQLKHWMSNCRVIEQSVNIILKLTRESTPFDKVVVSDGFYHQALDANLPCQLIRVQLNTELNTYPEISVGKHHVSIRFMQLDYAVGSPSRQNQQTFECKLACCRF